MNCSFQSDAAYYASVSSPPEPLVFNWDSETELATKFEWKHGGVPWFLHTDPGYIRRQGNYYDIDLSVTTADLPNDPRSLKGKLTLNALNKPEGVFATILEGSGAAWLVANGILCEEVSE